MNVREDALSSLAYSLHAEDIISSSSSCIPCVLIQNIVEKCPEGYPRLAAFLSSEPSFSVYRGFSYLHSRVLLGLQDQIVALERELDQNDSSDKENGLTSRLRSRARDEYIARREGEERSREQILDEIRIKLLQYGP